jgi:hypothetical protein
MSNGTTQTTRRELRIAIARGPECPACHETGFDDWWHDRTARAEGGTIKARLRCRGCGRFFSVSHYSDGETHSTAWRKAA